MSRNQDEPNTNNASDADAQLLTAVVPSRLATPGTSDELQRVRSTSWWGDAQRVASNWQATNNYPEIWEIAIVPRAQPGRANELAGLIAEGGEQFALALASIVESELWKIHRDRTPSEKGNLASETRRVVRAAEEMAHRAMAEMASHHILATGHTIANVTVRAMALDSGTHSLLLDHLGGWCPVGSTDTRDWLSLNRDTVRQLRRVAKKLTSANFQVLPEPATTLVKIPEWQRLNEIRGTHYHQRRPQSAGMSGVPVANPWKFSDGIITIEGGGGRAYRDADGLANDMSSLARQTLITMTAIMDNLLTQIHAIIAELNGRVASL